MNKKLPLKVRGIIIFALFIVFIIFLNLDEYRKAEELATKEAQENAEKVTVLQQQNIDYFNQNSAEILNGIKMSFQNGNYKEVISLSTKYLSSQNQELIRFNSKAETALAVITKEEKATKEKAERDSKTKVILARLKTIAVSKYQANKYWYQKLVNYNPDNKRFQTKLKFYSAKIREQKEKERIEEKRVRKEKETRIVKFGEPPKPSSWDGSYRPVDKYLERIANDPDSIEIDGCTKVHYTKDGWLVGCGYRGRNAFGGMIRQQNWFTIVHGRVIKMHDSSVYSQQN